MCPGICVPDLHVSHGMESGRYPKHESRFSRLETWYQNWEQSAKDGAGQKARLSIVGKKESPDENAPITRLYLTPAPEKQEGRNILSE